MPKYQAISGERHANKHYQNSTTYTFASANIIVQLVASELPKAIMSLPVGFIKQAGGFIPVAVLGFQHGVNLLVAPDGRWIGPYVPLVFRAYPFRLELTENSQKVLSIDEDSGLLGNGSEGERLFTEEGLLSRSVLDILNFLNQIDQSRLVTRVGCSIFQEYGLIRTWPITLKAYSGEQQIRGLFQIDEAAFNRLSDEALLRVREAGALPIVYCQLLSKQNLSFLGQLAEERVKVLTETLSVRNIVSGSDLNLELLNDSGTINFEGLG